MVLITEFKALMKHLKLLLEFGKRLLTPFECHFRLLALKGNLFEFFSQLHLNCFVRGDFGTGLLIQESAFLARGTGGEAIS